MSLTKQIDHFVRTPIEDRLQRSARYLSQNPSKVPVLLVNTHKGIELVKYKYLLPKDFTVIRLIAMVKKVGNCRPEEAVYMYANNKILKNDMTLEMAYELYKESDGFLYIKMTSMPTFGSH